MNTEQTHEPEVIAGKSPNNAKLVAILSYFLVGIIWYFVDTKMRNSELAKFHVKQSLNLAIISIVVGIVVQILMGILIFVPIFGWLLIALLAFAVPVFFCVLGILGIISAVKEQMKPIPFLGQFADRYLKF